MNINSFNNYNNSGGGPNNMSFGDRAKAMWSLVPLFVRIVIVTTLVIYLFSWFLPQIEYLVNIPGRVVFKVQIWRLFTSVFATLSIINILFAFISWVPDAMRLENTSGTVRYMLNFFTNATLINILFTLLMVLFGLFEKGALEEYSAGLWPLIMAEITMLCLANPDNPVQLFFIPCQFKALYYPWALFGLFTVFNTRIQFDLLAGIGYGYLFFYYLRTKIQFSNEFIQRCENFCLFRSLSRFQGFISLQQSGSNNNSGFSTFGPAPGNQQQTTTTMQVDRPIEAPVSTPFKGKGTVVGKFRK
jgi:membrane associated rhomboid family serine protease